MNHQGAFNPHALPVSLDSLQMHSLSQVAPGVLPHPPKQTPAGINMNQQSTYNLQASAVSIPSQSLQTWSSPGQLQTLTTPGQQTLTTAGQLQTLTSPGQLQTLTPQPPQQNSMMASLNMNQQGSQSNLSGQSFIVPLGMPMPSQQNNYGAKTYPFGFG